MLKQQGTYIYSIEGKDLYNKILEIKPTKKRKATLDYSLEAIEMENVAKAVYKNQIKKYKNLFYQVENKQYTDSIINITFKYNVKEYNLLTVKKKEYFTHNNSQIDNKTIKQLKFDNGIYKEKIENKEVIIAIEIGAETTLRSKDLPEGFGVKDNKIYLNSSGVKSIANSDNIRQKLYQDGFKIELNKNNKTEIVEFVRFKRSSGSSRVGKCLFIDKRLYGDMLEWSMMGLKFEEMDEIDLAGLEAYIALTTSSIIDTIEIEPRNILLIDDFKSTFRNKVMVTEIVKEKYIDDEGEEKERDRLHTEPKEIEITNSIWDGQSLLDVSLFEEKYKDKGMLLLRNRFFKSCCFNCNIQKFFIDNHITDVSQLNGKTLATNIEDIKLITTPSSIKYLKYGTWENYTKLLEKTFGIVKYDKPTHYFNGEMVQTHYQLLNTLQLNKNDIKELLKDTLDYIRLLKTDIRVFREHLHMKLKEDVEYGDMKSTDEFIMTMLQLNNKFEYTDLFIKFRQDSIKSYIRNIKRGHVLIHGNYSVLCGNGLEMLKSSCKDKEGESLFDGNSLLDIDEVYCKNFELERDLIGSRSPHVTMGNIWLPRNTNKCKSKQIDEYFNSSKQIIHVNSIKNNILERLSSADFDSDALLLSDNNLLINKARLNYEKFLVPTSNVHAKKVPRLNNAEQKCQLDIKTSKNLIGQIINCSQILNSLLWHIINSCKNYDEKYVDDLYAIISQLDVMSCIEIDKAKKEFSIDNEMELEDIRKKFVYGNKKPKFFKFLSQEKGNCVKAKNYKEYNTSMDYLMEVINKEMKGIRSKSRTQDNKITTFGEIFSKEYIIPLNGIHSKKANAVIKDSEELRNKISAIWAKENIDTTEKYNRNLEAKKDFINKIEKLHLSSADIKKIICTLDKESKKVKNGEEVKTELNKRARTLLSLLYHSCKEEFIKLFEETREPFEIIKMDFDNESQTEYIELYGLKYIINKNNT